MALEWKKAYRGPFTIDEALKLSRELRAKANPKKNGIYDAVAMREGKNQYCVYIRCAQYPQYDHS